jgi:hypothetical protein
MCARCPNIQNRKKGVSGKTFCALKRPICGYYTSALSGCQKAAHKAQTALIRHFGACVSMN